MTSGELAGVDPRAPRSLVARIVPPAQKTLAMVLRDRGERATMLGAVPASVGPVGETTPPVFGSMYHSLTVPGFCVHVPPPSVVA